jgi:uncharacterized membrane protein
MKLLNHKAIQWSAVLATLGVLIFVSSPFFKFFPFLDESILPLIMVIGWQISVAVWLTGIYLWHKSDIQLTGLIGFAMYMAGHLLIVYWLYNSNFVLSEAKKAFSLEAAVGIILYSSGIMTLGSTLINVGYFPRLATLFWVIGLIFVSFGLSSGLTFLIIAVGMIWCGIYFWISIGNKKISLPSAENKSENHQRFIPLDLLRGLIIIVMAIDHASLYILKTHPLEIWNSSVAGYFSNSGAFLTRFITHFCAPGFFFLMGAGMILFASSRKKKNWSHGRIIRHLILRGCIIIVLEKILWTTVVFRTIGYTKFGVLFGLGGAMLIGSLLIRFNRFVLLILGLAGLLITQVLPQFITDIGFYDHPIAILLLVPQSMGTWINTYPVIPWLSISVLGMVFGKELLKDSDKAYLKLLVAGLICLILFPIVRWTGGFGNFQTPYFRGWIEFLNVVKYPPSLGFTLITLGVNFVLLFLFEKIHYKLGIWKTPLLVFGKTALFFYFAHWFLFSAIGLLFFFIKGKLLWLYAGWAVGLLMLYPICKQYLEFKQRTSPASIWRLI